jgi:hypothetical protein
MHSLVSPDWTDGLFTQSVRSAVGKAASGALVPGCPLLPAAAYNPRSRVPQTQWGLAEFGVRLEGTPVL